MCVRVVEQINVIRVENKWSKRSKEWIFKEDKKIKEIKKDKISRLRILNIKLGYMW
jgi:hypothetical protein